MHVCKGGQISEVGAKFPKKYGPRGAKFPRKFGPEGGGQIFGRAKFPVTPDESVVIITVRSSAADCSTSYIGVIHTDTVGYRGIISGVTVGQILLCDSLVYVLVLF